jgi:hypothetical protein
MLHIGIITPDAPLPEGVDIRPDIVLIASVNLALAKVNPSSLSLVVSQRLKDHVDRVSSQSGIPHAFLYSEIVESVFTEDV